MILTIDMPDDLLARATAAGLALVQVSHFAITGIATAIDAVFATLRMVPSGEAGAMPIDLRQAPD